MGRGRLVIGVVDGPGSRGGGGAGKRPLPPIGGARPDPRSPRSLGISITSSVTLAPPVPDTVIGNTLPTGADVVLALERVGNTLRSLTIIVCVSIIVFLIPQLMFCGPRRVTP